MTNDIAGKAVVITGAPSGIGKAVADALGKHGARLALAARRVQELEATARGCTEGGAEALAPAAGKAEPGVRHPG